MPTDPMPCPWTDAEWLRLAEVAHEARRTRCLAEVARAQDDLHRAQLQLRIEDATRAVCLARAAEFAISEADDLKRIAAQKRLRRATKVAEGHLAKLMLEDEALPERPAWPDFQPVADAEKALREREAEVQRAAAAWYDTAAGGDDAP